MRIAIISDIHGNLVALEAVLAAIQRERVDQIVCLGDVAANGPQPHQVIARLRELGCSVVKGNTDEWFLVPQTFDPNSEKERHLMEMLHWGEQQLAPADVEFLRTFPPRVEISLENGATLLCFHGSPQSNTEIILATTPDEQLALVLGNYHATVMAGGHTHAQMLRRYRTFAMINPGSVCMPMERGAAGESDRRPPRAEYAIVASHGDNLAIEFRRVPVHLDELRRDVRESGMPQAEAWLKDWR